MKYLNDGNRFVERRLEIGAAVKGRQHIFTGSDVRGMEGRAGEGPADFSYELVGGLHVHSRRRP